MAELPSYLDELDQFLLDQGDNWMLLTQLDGYLAGVLVSPDLIPPGSWLKPIWTDEDGEPVPHLQKMEDFQHLIDLIMRHYNEVLASLDQPGTYQPLFEIDTRSEDILWEMWVEGFVQAMDLAPDGWHRIASSDDVGCKAALKGIAKLHAIANGKGRISGRKQERWTAEAPDLIPIWVEMLHAWRLENDPARPSSPRPGKVGRNDLCPFGSGKKYKKCCGLN
jgi:uncharacterized protein